MSAYAQLCGAMGDLLAGWQRRRVAEVAALVAAGILEPGEVGARMEPPATAEAAAGYMAMVPELPGRGELMALCDGARPDSTRGVRARAAARPVPAARGRNTCAALLSPCEVSG